MIDLNGPVLPLRVRNQKVIWEPSEKENRTLTAFCLNPSALEFFLRIGSRVTNVRKCNVWGVELMLGAI